MTFDERTEPGPVHSTLGTACVLWTGAKTAGGYGALRVDGKVVYAHRHAWERAHGPIPAGLVLCHRCDVRACVNVDHHFLGDEAANARDMWAKGRAWQQTSPERASRGERHPRAKLSDAQVSEIRAAVSRGETRRAIAGALYVSASTVGRIAAGKSRKERVAA